MDARAYRMFTARAASSATVASEMSDWIIISTLAQRLSTGRVGGRKRGAGVERQKQIVDEAGAPLVFAHGDLGFLVQRHLRKQEGAVGVLAAQLAGIRAAGVQPPVPRREDEDVGDPQLAGGTEQGERSLPVLRQRGDQQAEGPGHVRRDHRDDEVAEESGQLVPPEMRRQPRAERQHADHDEKQPVGTDRQLARQRQRATRPRRRSRPSRASAARGMLGFAALGDSKLCP